MNITPEQIEEAEFFSWEEVYAATHKIDGGFGAVVPSAIMDTLNDVARPKLIAQADEIARLTEALAASERRVKLYEQSIDRQLAGIQDDPDREEPYRTMDAGGRVQLYCLKGTVERLLSSPQPAPQGAPFDEELKHD